MVQRLGAKMGRNERCPCGSGRKFKVCHGRDGGFVERNLHAEAAAEAPRGRVSDSLLEVARPFLPDAPTKADYERVLTLAQVAWQLAVLEGGDAGRGEYASLRRVVDQLQVASVIHLMVERKRRLFPHDHRLMLDFRVTRLDDGRLYVEAAAMR